jgi:hypothetical protein
MKSKMKKFLINLGNQAKEKFIDLMALFISTVAVFISIRQGTTQKRLEILNKQPLLNIEFIKHDSSKIAKGLLVNNVGFGPAIVESFKIYLNNRDFNKKLAYSQWLDSSGNFIFPVEYYFDDIVFLNPGYVLTTDPREPLYLLAKDTTRFYPLRSRQYMDSLIIEIEYKSISPFDNTMYYLRFCELFRENNIRDRKQKNLFEWDQ